MLHQFSWQQFLIASILLTSIWYLAIILLYYRGQVGQLFYSRLRKKQSEKNQQQQNEEPEGDLENENLMGRHSEPEGMSSIAMDALHFSSNSSNGDQQRDSKLGLLPDVMEELKSIFQILKNENGTKEDFLSLFLLISSKYARIKGTSNQRAINEFIRENVDFDLSDQELDKLWP